MNFNEWYSINPFRDEIEALELTEKEKKILTPVILNSSFVLEARPFYMELAKIQREHILPTFLVRQFSVTYKKRFFSAFSYYDLEKELEYLIKFIPEAMVLQNKINATDKHRELLLKDLNFFTLSLEKGFNELIKILHNGKLIGWKFKHTKK